MRKSIFSIITVVSMAICTNNIFAQVRPDIITDFTSSDRTTLINAMMNYIDKPVLESHCNYNTVSNTVPPQIHSDFDFLPFHRMYIQGMEDYLISQGYPQFVPLPKWDPSVCTPNEFQTGGPNSNGIDPDCSSASCFNGNGPCSNIPTWCPGTSLPIYLSLPIQAGGNNDICDWSMSPIIPPVTSADVNCCPSGLSRKHEAPYHDGVHVAMNGVMVNFRSPAAPIFWLWHAYVDDLWKSWEENCPQSTTASVDLWMADNRKLTTSDRDRGEEPDIDNGPMWISDDIWVRNQPDGIANQVTQNPEHSSINDPGQLNYIYVRVRNRGFQPSLGTEVLDLRWAKAATSLSWPNNWDGTIDLDPPNNALAGDSLDTLTIPVIQPGSSTILVFTWNPPDPNAYATVNSEPWHFCLLARVVASNDPMTFTETSDLNGNVKNNNNIVWKNITVVDNVPFIVGGGGDCNKDIMQGIGTAVAVTNPFNQSETFDIIFEVPAEELGHCPQENCTHVIDTTEVHEVFGFPDTFPPDIVVHEPAIPITKEGTVIIALDEQLYQKWVQGGRKGTGFTEIRATNTSTIVIADRKMFEITGITASFNNIKLDAGELLTTSMMVLYPTNPISDKQKFKYDMIQKRTDNGQVIGGVRYDINKPTNDDPVTDAGSDITIGRRCSTTLTAAPQMDCSVYFWLNEQGNIISKEPSITVSPLTTTTYTLKIVSSQGFISNDNVTVSVDNNNTAIACGPTPTGCFKDVIASPNPVAGNQLNVQFMVEEKATINISLVDMQGRVREKDRVIEEPPGLVVRILPLDKVPPGVYKMIIQCMEKRHEIIVTRL